MSEQLNIFNQILSSLDAIHDKLDRPPRPFLNHTEAAKYLGVPKSVLYTLCSKKKIKYFKRGKRSYFKISDLDDFILNERNRIRTQEELESETY
jgi:excisionase family DNA binding protein